MKNLLHLISGLSPQSEWKYIYYYVHAMCHSALPYVMIAGQRKLFYTSVSSTLSYTSPLPWINFNITTCSVWFSFISLTKTTNVRCTCVAFRSLSSISSLHSPRSWMRVSWMELSYNSCSLEIVYIYPHSSSTTSFHFSSQMMNFDGNSCQNQLFYANSFCVSILQYLTKLTRTF